MCEFETIKRQWEVRNLTSGEIAWLIKEVEELKRINKFNDKLDKKRREDQNNEFDELYKNYEKEVKNWSGGLIQTNKSDFLKMYAFYSIVDYPTIQKYVDAFLGKRK